MSSSKPFTILKSAHTGITVSSLSSSLKFWRDLLGGEVLYTRTLKNSPTFDVVGIPDAEFNIAMVSIGGYMIELLEYSAPEDRKHFKPRACDVGNVHVALEVQGSKGLIKAAEELGWRAANESGPQEMRRMDGSLWCMIYLFGPDGTTVELMEKLE